MTLEEMNMAQLAARRKVIVAIIEDIEKSKEKPKAFLKALEDMMLRRLQESGASAIATPDGTVHTVGRTTARILDPAEFRGFIIETRAWDMLDWKANMSACRAFMENEKQPVPGVELSTYRYLSVTAPKPAKGSSDV